MCVGVRYSKSLMQRIKRLFNISSSWYFVWEDIQLLYSIAYICSYVTRFAKRGLICAPFQDRFHHQPIANCIHKQACSLKFISLLLLHGVISEVCQMSMTSGQVVSLWGCTHDWVLWYCPLIWLLFVAFSAQTVFIWAHLEVLLLHMLLAHHYRGFQTPQTSTPTGIIMAK